jgi:hypothetical protein
MDADHLKAVVRNTVLHIDPNALVATVQTVRLGYQADFTTPPPTKKLTDLRRCSTDGSAAPDDSIDELASAARNWLCVLLPRMKTVRTCADQSFASTLLAVDRGGLG